MGQILDIIASAQKDAAFKPRLLTLLADGTDHLAAEQALERDWELVIPLPFGRALNAAINSGAKDPAVLRAILDGKPVEDAEIAQKVESISTLAEKGSTFELADNDERLTKLMLAAVDHPGNAAAQGAFAAEAGQRAALAGKILIEQSDLLLAVWDGQSTANVGGTGHTALLALELGTPVVWIDPAHPESWQIVWSPEELSRGQRTRDRDKVVQQLHDLVENAASTPDDEARYALTASAWRERSALSSHAFRRIEKMFGSKGLSSRFGSIRQNYEHPEAIAGGSGKPLLDALGQLTPGNNRLGTGIAEQILQRFAWLDGVASHLSDQHRSGMIINFLLGAGAIIIGVLYLPLVDAEQKWIFASIELLLLLVIVINTAMGQRRKLHSRWFETRRAAEYLRHSPMLAALGVARPGGAWPEAAGSHWPEWYARQVSRAISLPHASIDQEYLRKALAALRDHHVDPQRKYHKHKAEHLDHVHHGIDGFSEVLFVGAIALVTAFLVLTAGAAFGWLDPSLAKGSAKWFTVLAVALPTLGGAFAGIRYFGDFERFAEISQVTAGKLDVIAQRIDVLLEAPHGAVTYDKVADIAHTTDQIVFEEIQNWQAVFSGKIIAVPA